MTSVFDSTTYFCLLSVWPAEIDLSKATRLQNLVFRPTSLSVEWITTAFQATVLKHRGLRKISLYIHPQLTFFDADTIKRSASYREWLDLDRLLVQFWESRSTSPKVICRTPEGEEGDRRYFTGCFLPELTQRGMVGLNE